MNYALKSFSVALGASKITDEAWERTFGRKEAAVSPTIVTPPPTVEELIARVRELEDRERVLIAERDGAINEAAALRRERDLLRSKK